MPQLIYASDALDDLRQIARYTLQTWGLAQSFKYTAQLRAAYRRIAQNPYLGQSCDHIRPGLRRMPQGSHIVFYEPGAEGIRIVRILHGNMSTPLHLSD